MTGWPIPAFIRLNARVSRLAQRTRAVEAGGPQAPPIAPRPPRGGRLGEVWLRKAEPVPRGSVISYRQCCKRVWH